MRARHWLRLAAVLICTYSLIAQTDQRSAPLTIDQIVNLSRAGLSDEVIITKIKKSGKAFDLSPDELIALRKNGLTDAVIRSLLDPGSPDPTPSRSLPVERSNSGTPVPTPTPNQRPSDPYAALIPPEPGIYGITEGPPARLDD